MFKYYEEKIINELIEKLEDISSTKHYLHIGEMKGQIYLGNDEYKEVTGELYLKLNNDTRFRLIYHENNDRFIDDFDFFGNVEVTFIDNLEKILIEFISDIFEEGKNECFDDLEIDFKGFHNHIGGD